MVLKERNILEGDYCDERLDDGRLDTESGHERNQVLER